MAGVSSATSTIDVNSIVSQLMTIESRKKTLLQRDEAGYQVKLTAAGALSSSLSSFKTAMDSLRNIGSFQSAKAVSGDSTVLTASASSTATPGTYSLEVTQLAKANMLASTAYVDTASAIATGTLTIQVGTGASKDVVIDSTNNTLAGIRDAINKAGTDVTASIVNDGTGYKLITTANKMGASNTIKVTVTGDSVGTDTDATGLSSLVYDPAGTQNMTQIQTAQSATLKMGTLTITKDSNTITDVVQGVTLNLVKQQVGTPVSLTVSNDTSVASASITKFVNEFNSLIKTINEQSGYNTATKKSGPLGGDSAVRQIASQVRRVITETIPGLSSGVNSLAQIGISTQKDGTLAIDSAKLSTAMTSNFSDIAKLFAKVGAATDANISMISSTTATVAGTYSIDITQAATQGKIVGGAAVGSLTIDGTNNALSLSINGVAGSITLASATYASGAALASEIQSKINGVSAFSAAGITAAVAYDSGTGKISITSNTYGSASTVDTISGSAATNLRLDTGVSTAGADVAGTIGGYTATGTGQKLTGIAGSSVGGLSLTVAGSATGARGSLTYSIGAAETLYNNMNTLLDVNDGIIKSKTDSLNATIKRIQTSVSNEEERLSRTEKMLRLKYVALQSTLNSLQGVGSFLDNQLTGLEKLIKG